MPRNPVEKCDITFEDRYGSTTSGNLPTHKNECIESLLGDSTISGSNIWKIHQEQGLGWVTVNDFHFYHMKCPYSNEAATLRYDVDGNPEYVTYVRDVVRSSHTYWQMIEVAPGDRVSHTTTSGIMIRYSRGSKHGWLCVDPDCPYYKDNNKNKNYFYI